MSGLFSHILKAQAGQTLGAMASFLKKAEAHAREAGVEDEVYLAARLSPDMFKMSQQVQVACDICVRGGSRLAGVEPPSFPDTETTFAELSARCDAANAYVQGLDDAALDAGETREVPIPTGPDSTMPGEGKFYLTNFVLPNLHFHAAMAYGLLRQQGVPLGKRDFLLPGGG
ncbi:MAG: DUF1993 domain-containing protein [Pseudomonadota bacterium]